MTPDHGGYTPDAQYENTLIQAEIESIRREACGWFKASVEAS